MLLEILMVTSSAWISLNCVLMPLYLLGIVITSFLAYTTVWSHVILNFSSLFQKVIDSLWHCLHFSSVQLLVRQCKIKHSYGLMFRTLHMTVILKLRHETAGQINKRNWQSFIHASIIRHLCKPASKRSHLFCHQEIRQLG